MMRLSDNPRVFHQYEYEIKDGPIVEGRISALNPGSLTDRRARVFQGDREITGPYVEVRITQATIRVFPTGGMDGDVYMNVFVHGTRLSERGLLMADERDLLVHNLPINKAVREQFLASHPEYQARPGPCS
jgi:hypothetical protein